MSVAFKQPASNAFVYSLEPDPYSTIETLTLFDNQCCEYFPGPCYLNEGFWSTTTNGFVLLKAMVGLTLLDVVAILILPIHGEKLSLLFGTCCSTISTSFGIKFSKNDWIFQIHAFQCQEKWRSSSRIQGPSSGGSGHSLSRRRAPHHGRLLRVNRLRHRKRLRGIIK
ncbi:hypothetical protein JHK86_035072 [Glycine max]|nr:hypothetical protein JHK86_035072 [Glycine max]